MNKAKQAIENNLQYLASLSISELKELYLSNNVDWVYIAELKERKHISIEEMLYITGFWK